MPNLIRGLCLLHKRIQPTKRKETVSPERILGLSCAPLKSSTENKKCCRYSSYTGSWIFLKSNTCMWTHINMKMAIKVKVFNSILFPKALPLFDDIGFFCYFFLNFVKFDPCVLHTKRSDNVFSSYSRKGCRAQLCPFEILNRKKVCYGYYP